MEIVKCPCGKKEYRDLMIWHDGIQWCRACTFSRWQKETNYKWQPRRTDYVFPLDTDGVDRSKEEST